MTKDALQQLISHACEYEADMKNVAKIWGISVHSVKALRSLRVFNSYPEALRDFIEQVNGDAFYPYESNGISRTTVITVGRLLRLKRKVSIELPEDFRWLPHYKRKEAERGMLQYLIDGKWPS